MKLVHPERLRTCRDVADEAAAEIHILEQVSLHKAYLILLRRLGFFGDFARHQNGFHVAWMRSAWFPSARLLPHISAKCLYHEVVEALAGNYRATERVLSALHSFESLRRTLEQLVLPLQGCAAEGVVLMAARSEDAIAALCCLALQEDAPIFMEPDELQNFYPASLVESPAGIDGIRFGVQTTSDVLEFGTEVFSFLARTISFLRSMMKYDWFRHRMGPATIELIRVLASAKELQSDPEISPSDSRILSTLVGGVCSHETLQLHHKMLVKELEEFSKN